MNVCVCVCVCVCMYVCMYEVTVSMELSPPWETNSRRSSQLFPGLSWNPKAYYQIHKNTSLVPILRQIV
jgi:hypothetical protein